MVSKRYFKEINSLSDEEINFILLPGTAPRAVLMPQGGVQTDGSIQADAGTAQPLREVRGGKWHDQLVSNRHKLYVYYLFAADGKYTKYAKEASRDSTTIGGTPVYGDWKTEEYFAEGRWYLKCSELDGRLEDKLVLEEKQVGGIVASINQFVYADEHVLVFRDIWYSRSPRTFHRGNPGSGF